jgi:hypothetical protein
VNSLADFDGFAFSDHGLDSLIRPERFWSASVSKELQKRGTVPFFATASDRYTATEPK